MQLENYFSNNLFYKKTDINIFFTLQIYTLLFIDSQSKQIAYDCDTSEWS